jgi:group II intron reverse transcriptase/maturase
MYKAKSFDIPKRLVWEAYQGVKANRGAAGVDGQSLEDFDNNLGSNLYKLWNRMSSGSYMPPAVRRVSIPKKGGGTRPLGIPTVADRIGQMVVKLVLEPKLNQMFHPDSYGYRQGKSAHQALAKVRERCWRYDWVIDLDIKGYFDAIDHELLMKAVRRHTNESWILLYIERWLKVDVQFEDDRIECRTKGTPQGGVVSPLLANLFLHYVFDKWMERHQPHVPFARYADDVVCHCQTKLQAEGLLCELQKRFAACHLELHPQKTKLVYCKDDRRRCVFTETSFDFLGYTFRARPARTRKGELFVGFNPAVSRKSLKSMNEKVRQWGIARRTQQDIHDLVDWLNPVVRGWVEYYGRYNRAELFSFLSRLDLRLAKWARRKYRRLRGQKDAQCVG